MNPELELVDVAVFEVDCIRMGVELSSDAAMTLLALASEDPVGWSDLVAIWPRYRTPGVPEFAIDLPMEFVDREIVSRKFQSHSSWVILDLVHKRIFTGRAIEPIGRDQVLAMSLNNSEDGSDDTPEETLVETIEESLDGEVWPLSIHLPPWWELHEGVEVEAVDLDHPNPRTPPCVRREVLFGEPMIADLVGRILSLYGSEEWQSSGARNDLTARQAFTVRIHRDWLMTPRQDLGGLMPRQMLLGGIEWVGRLSWAQQVRFAKSGNVVALPASISQFESGPMGLEEVVVYFDLCRELIEEGWNWCLGQNVVQFAHNNRSRTECDLKSVLTDAMKTWLVRPFEGDAPPNFIIECSRRRVPRGDGVQINGMTEGQTETHSPECDCPICLMLADGGFGTGFTFLDGHHLELEGEFAFSLHETREEWELEQLDFDAFSDDSETNADEFECELESELDEFASAWSGGGLESRLPEDPQGHMKLAFLLAEVVSALKSYDAFDSDIKQLNEHFVAFRRADRTERIQCGQRMCEYLEGLTDRYPLLISRAADLQSRIADYSRVAATDGFELGGL